MKKKLDFNKFKLPLLYTLSGIAILALVFVGTLEKTNSNTTLNLNTFADDNYKLVSSDQISELYTVADLSSALNLASAEATASNYAITTTMYKIGQTTSGKLEKDPILDASSYSRGVKTYTVQKGETMESIAKKYNLTTDQIRWSNGLKTTAISEGASLLLPNVSGIVYKVKSGDTISSIASKYGSTVEEITHLNDLELSGIKEGLRIVIKGGTLPEKERPEYVAPVRTTYYYSTSGGSSSRLSLTTIQTNLWLSTPYTSGQCTSYAWYMRQDLPGNLGNANTWAANAAANGFPVDHNPRAGDVFQYNTWDWGHVGYVMKVNDDGTVVIREMNYNYRAGTLTESLISANVAKQFNYIHKK